MTAPRVTLEKLYERFDEIAEGRTASSGADAHCAVVDRLTANRRAAEARGWTSCALERTGGMGRLRAWGLAPRTTERQPIPDEDANRD